MMKPNRCQTIKRQAGKIHLFSFQAAWVWIKTRIWRLHPANPASIWQRSFRGSHRLIRCARSLNTMAAAKVSSPISGKVKGPLFSPAKWHFNVSGDVKDLVLKNLPGRPGPLKIASAKFKADPHTLGLYRWSFKHAGWCLENIRYA